MTPWKASRFGNSAELRLVLVMPNGGARAQDFLVVICPEASLTKSLVVIAYDCTVSVHVYSLRNTLRGSGCMRPDQPPLSLLGLCSLGQGRWLRQITSGHAASGQGMSDDLVTQTAVVSANVS